MNTASILLPLNTRMGSLHLKALSDQSLMELFVENVDDFHKAQFQNSDGTYKDTCKWIGIKCDKKRRVTRIHWEQEFPGTQWSGHLDFALLPQHCRHSSSIEILAEHSETAELIFEQL